MKNNQKKKGPEEFLKKIHQFMARVLLLDPDYKKLVKEIEEREIFQGEKYNKFWEEKCSIEKTLEKTLPKKRPLTIKPSNRNYKNAQKLPKLERKLVEINLERTLKISQLKKKIRHNQTIYH